MKLRVASVELYDYTRVAALTMSGEEGVEVRLELPIQVVDEVGWSPKVGDEVELELSASAGNLDAWDIVLSGRPLKAGGGAVTFTFGGLLCTVKGVGAEPPKRLFLKLRVPRSRGPSA